MKSKFKFVILALIILTIAFIWFNSSQSREESTGRSTGLLNFIADMLEPVGIDIDTTDDHWIRKAAHFAEFGLLGTELAVLAILCGSYGLQGDINCMFAGLSVAVVDETIQVFSNRGSSVTDVILDFSGIVCAVIFVKIIYAIIKKRKD